MRMSNLTAKLALVLLIFGIGAGLALSAANSSANRAQSRTRSRNRFKGRPSPTPRRPLPKPVAGSRGFDQFNKREASSRLIAGAATRGGDSAGDAYAAGETAYAADKYEDAITEFSEAVSLKPNWAEA